MIEYAVRVYVDGDKSWHLKGKLHREDGPAIEYSNGDKRWYLNDVRYTEESFKKKTAKTVELTVSEICDRLGYNVKVVK